MVSLCPGAVSVPELNENQISRHIVECAIEVHRTLGGPGLLEKVYEQGLIWELKRRGLSIDDQVRIPISYKCRSLDADLRIDLIVGGKVIIEYKAVTVYNKILEAQTQTYLRLTSLKLGIVINFGERIVKNGIHRVVNGL